ncbi:hypothetical protein NJ7G_1269 [Natrinema sp. J7-2]|nr:hypothetical protein NJ7G_1269 [Natrinema sp. J7-2]
MAFSPYPGFGFESNRCTCSDRTAVVAGTTRPTANSDGSDPTEGNCRRTGVA